MSLFTNKLYERSRSYAERFFSFIIARILFSGRNTAVKRIRQVPLNGVKRNNLKEVVSRFAGLTRPIMFDLE
jgi:hypothetical protein